MFKYSTDFAISRSFASSAVATSSRVGIACFALLVAFSPHSQYMQSKVHTLPSAGNRLMPNEIPSLRLFTGPNIGDG